MFDWFKEKYSRPKHPTWDDVPPLTDMEKIGQDMSKVIQFPELKELKAAPKEEVAKDTGGKTVYSVGLTDDNRVSIIVGYSSMTMTALGVQQLIDQLTLFKSQIEPTDENEE